MGKKIKRKKWVKFRHKVVYFFAYPLIYLFCKIKYRIKIEKFKPKRKQNYFIVYNHQTFADHFFVPMVTKTRKMYYVASEDICSNGFISKLLRYAIAPIAMDKTSVGISTVMKCMNIVKEGGSIVIAPEGNRTYSGKTEFIKPSIVKLIRALKIPLMIIRIEGGYGVQPRWTDKVRRGKIQAKVWKIISFEEYSEFSDQEFYEIIKQGLFVNEANIDNRYKSNKKAEYLERVIYTCPSCGFSKWESNGNFSKCSTCGKTVEYLENKSIRGDKFPFKFINDWYEYQNDFVRKADLSLYNDKPLFTDKVRLFNVILNKNKHILSKDCKVELYADRIALSYNDIEEIVYFNDIGGMACLGRNKLSFKFLDKIYQFKGDKRFNPVKFINFFYKYKNIEEENYNGIFLGL